MFVCGHYEGIDDRAYCLADEVVSIGDYVLTSGELASMVVIDAVVRKIPGVLGAEGVLRANPSRRACWNILNTRGRRNTAAWRYRKCCSRAIMPASKPGGKSSLSNAPGSFAPTCLKGGISSGGALRCL